VSTYIAVKDDIPSEFRLGKPKEENKSSSLSNKLLSAIVNNDDNEVVDYVDEEEISGEVVPYQNPEMTDYSQDMEDVEDDFEIARQNLKNMLQMNSEIVEEYNELVKGTDAPKAFEVYSRMVLAGADLSKKLMELHEQKQTIKQKTDVHLGKTNTTEAVSSGSTTTIQNQQNIVLSPMEAIRILKEQKGITG
jgi:hypothetical protein